MKVVAYVKAEEKQDDIPHKFSRVIAGHHLINWTLYALKHSKYINEIIVATNSDDVRILCGNRNLKPYELDYVVEDYDILVVVKSTSLMLYSELIDSLIEYALNTKAKIVKTMRDTVTIYNKQGEIKEAYKQISTIESADLDDFKNLYSITENRYKVGYYVNGNNTRGLGHIFRALDIADDFYIRPDIYYDINQTKPEFFGETLQKLIPVDGEEELFKKCKKNNYDIFISDILATTIEYMDSLREAMPNARLVNFEDDGIGNTKADLVFNALFEKETKGNIYSGDKYYTCDEAFLMYEPRRINETVKNIFVSFGGADPSNYTDRLLKIVANDEYKNFNFNIVIGKAKKNIDEIMKYNDCPNINILYNVSNMAYEMSYNDIAITSRGNVAYELSMLAIPTISIAQNENEEKHEFACEENGFRYLGRNPSDEVIKKALDEYLYMSKQDRTRISKTLINFDIKGGRKRVMDLINDGQE